MFGVAQPTVPGLKSILTVLSCQPKTVEVENDGRRRSSFAATPEVEGQSTLWISTREETLVYMYVPLLFALSADMKRRPPVCAS